MPAARPIYETGNDRANERAVALRMAVATGLKAEKLAGKYPLDFALVGPRRVEAFLEVKCRRYARASFGDYMISLDKFLKMMELEARTDALVMLAVQWTDCLGTATLPVPFYVGMGGRADRGDSQDREPCAFIGIAKNFRVWANA